MCILILLRGRFPEFPIVVGNNRDERRDRASSPPGLFVGERHRMLSPRDREHGGTWIAIDDRGWFAGITNVAGEPPVPGAPSRGHLPHLALDQGNLAAGVEAVRQRVAERAHSAFQLVLCDARRTLVVRHVRGTVTARDWTDDVLVVTNEHGPGELAPRFLPSLTGAADVERTLGALAMGLRHPGGDGQHTILKRGEHHGTVSSSLLAIPARDPRALVWRYAAGSPDVAPYRNYGNLGRRLLPEPLF